MKKIIIVTGGAGFIGSNLINYLVKKTNFKIISIDNYSTGRKKRITLKVTGKSILDQKIQIFFKTLKKYKKISTIFHFGEFSRIFMSFKNIDKCSPIQIC